MDFFSRKPSDRAGESVDVDAFIIGDSMDGIDRAMREANNLSAGDIIDVEDVPLTDEMYDGNSSAKKKKPVLLICIVAAMVAAGLILVTDLSPSPAASHQTAAENSVPAQLANLATEPNSNAVSPIVNTGTQPETQNPASDSPTLTTATPAADPVLSSTPAVTDSAAPMAVNAPLPPHTSPISGITGNPATPGNSGSSNNIPVVATVHSTATIPSTANTAIINSTPTAATVGNKAITNTVPTSVIAPTAATTPTSGSATITANAAVVVAPVAPAPAPTVAAVAKIAPKTEAKALVKPTVQTAPRTAPVAVKASPTPAKATQIAAAKEPAATKAKPIAPESSHSATIDSSQQSETIRKLVVTTPVKYGVRSVQPEGLVFEPRRPDERPITTMVGDILPNGERLVRVDAKSNTIVTDRTVVRFQ